MVSAVEIGYAYAKGDKNIFGLLTDRRRWDRSLEGVSVNNMIWGACKKKGDIYKTMEGLISDLRNLLENAN